MATPNTSAARSTPRRAAGTYAPPTPLQDLHILDVLELAGSQSKAGIALAMHQSTVCRSLQLMQHQFKLEPRHGSPVCRHGHNACLHYLRLAYREHRLMEGLLRIGTDGLHQPLLESLAEVQKVPSRFRSAQHWAELVRHGLLDGALVSSFCLEQPPQDDQPAQWEGLQVVDLGQLRVELVAMTPDTRRVLLPSKGTTALLHETLTSHGFEVEQQPVACQEPAAWIKRARDRGLALPLCTGLLGDSWRALHKLEPLPEQSGLSERLWLLLPQGMEGACTARQCLRHLRSQIARAQTMQGVHERHS